MASPLLMSFTVHLEGSAKAFCRHIGFPQWTLSSGASVTTTTSRDETPDEESKNIGTTPLDAKRMLLQPRMFWVRQQPVEEYLAIGICQKADWQA